MNNLTQYYIAFHDPIWILLLSSALFFPVRKLIWVLYVRKKQKSQTTVSDDEKITLNIAFICLNNIQIAVISINSCIYFNSTIV